MCGAYHCVHVCAQYSPWPAGSLAPLLDPPKRVSSGCCHSSPTARTPDNRHAHGMHPTPWPHARHAVQQVQQGRAATCRAARLSQVGDGARHSTVPTTARPGSSRAMSTERSYVGVEWHAKSSISPGQARRDIPAHRPGYHALPNGLEGGLGYQTRASQDSSQYNTHR